MVQCVIHKCQSAFLHDRYIIEGPVALQEIVHELKHTKQRAIILKQDFEKAYDRVNWEFIHEVLYRKGFDTSWVHRIMQLASGSQMAITVNGEVGNFFRNKCGLR